MKRVGAHTPKGAAVRKHRPSARTWHARCSEVGAARVAVRAAPHRPETLIRGGRHALALWLDGRWARPGYGGGYGSGYMGGYMGGYGRGYGGGYGMGYGGYSPYGMYGMGMYGMYPPPPPPPAPTSEAEVTIYDNYFEPRKVYLTPGGTVRW